MKKLIMATLLMSVTSVASAQVNLYGRISAFVDNTKLGDSASTTQVLMEPNSNLGLSVKEDLGNGLAVRAVVETSLRDNTFGGSNTRLGDRQSTVGLANNLGSVDLGRNVHGLFSVVSNNDVFGTFYGSIVGNVHNLRDRRLDNAVFVTARPVKGLALAFDHAPNSLGPDANVFAVSGKLLNVNGAVAHFEQGSEKSTVLGLNTVFQGFKLVYVHSDDRGLVKSKGDSFGVARDFDKITAKVSFGRTNNDVKAFAVGADYNLSKRTALNLAFSNLNLPGDTNDVKSVGAGITHRF